MVARDYKSHATRKQKKSLPGYIWLFSGLAIGLFVALIVYLDKQPENETSFGEAVQVELEKLKQQAKKPEPEKTVSKHKEDSEREDSKQKFNFYTLLPELEVLIPESETRPPEKKQPAKPLKKAANTSSNSNRAKSYKKYILQVGSFQNKNDAEKLKANLAFMGITANIQHVTVNRQAWHRVRTGPYDNKKQLYQNQQKLRRNDIDSIPMELK